MPEAVVSGLFTMAVALLGGFIGFQTHKHFRKDKFNELVYHEKLAIYKEISKDISMIDYAAFSSRSVTISSALSEYSWHLLNTIQENQLIISNELYKACWHLASMMAEIDIGKKYLDEKLVKSYDLECKSIQNIMRNELGIESISQDIVELLSSNSRILSEMKTGKLDKKPNIAQ
jgi:hypothetical protein